MSWDSLGWVWATTSYHADRARTHTVLEVKVEPERLQRLRRLLANNVSIERLHAELTDPRNRLTAQVTIEAIMLTVRERGLAALKEPANIERLMRCDAAAKAQINERIERLKLQEPL
jgi:hypothetical protein